MNIAFQNMLQLFLRKRTDPLDKFAALAENDPFLPVSLYEMTCSTFTAPLSNGSHVSVSTVSAYGSS